MSTITKTTKNGKASQTSAKRNRQAAMEADAKAKVAKLHQMEAEHLQNSRGRTVALLVSLFLNLFFLVTIFTILEYNS